MIDLLYGLAVLAGIAVVGAVLWLPLLWVSRHTEVVTWAALAVLAIGAVGAVGGIVRTDEAAPWCLWTIVAAFVIGAVAMVLEEDW